MRPLLLMRVIPMLAALFSPPALPAQEPYIDLGTDTVWYDGQYEYIAAFEMDRYMESFVFYRSAMESYVRGDMVGAKAAVNKAMKLNRNELRFKLLKAWILSKDNAYKKAIKYSDRILEQAPGSSEALHCRAYNQYMMKDHDGAIRTYDMLLSLNGGDARAYAGRAAARMAARDYRGAIADYSSALTIRPAMEPAYEGRAMAFFRVYEFRAAIRDFNQFLVARPGSGKAYYYRGLSFLRLNEFADACKSLEQAVQLGHKEAAAEFGQYCNY